MATINSATQWKPVDLRKLRNGTANNVQQAGSGSHSYSWYENHFIHDIKRAERLKRYAEMDKTIDISRALDIIAEDISSDGVEDGRMIDLFFDDNYQFKKTQITALEKAIKLYTRQTGFDTTFFDHIRAAAQNGMALFRKFPDGKIKKLLNERIRGYVLDKDDNEKVTHYIYDPNGHFTNENGDMVHVGEKQGTSLEYLSVDELLIIRFGKGPFGQSLLEPVYNVWKQVKLLTDAVVIYRVVRAPERRVYTIDVGKMPMAKAEAHVNKIKRRMQQKQVIRNGEVSDEYNPASMSEEIFLAQTADGKGSRVDALPGGSNLGQIEDLIFLDRKLALGLRVPPSYLESYDTNSGGGGQVTSDGRLGTAYLAEQRYAGYIERLQRKIVKSIEAHFYEFCNAIGVVVPEGVEVRLAPPANFVSYKMAELGQALLNTYSASENVASISKRFSLKKYLQLAEHELVENEYAKLMELGFSPAEIKAMPDHERYNRVYADGSKFPNSGEDEEEEFGGRPKRQPPASETDTDDEPK